MHESGTKLQFVAWNNIIALSTWEGRDVSEASVLIALRSSFDVQYSMLFTEGEKTKESSSSAEEEAGSVSSGVHVE